MNNLLYYRIMKQRISLPYTEFEGTVQANAYILDENKENVSTIEKYCKSNNIEYKLEYEQDYDVAKHTFIETEELDEFVFPKLDKDQLKALRKFSNLYGFLIITDDEHIAMMDFENNTLQ